MIEYPLTDVSTSASKSLSNVDTLPVEVVLVDTPKLDVVKVWVTSPVT